jgi:non-ribosomal peptide synthetase component F
MLIGICRRALPTCLELEAVYEEKAAARFDLALFVQEEQPGMSGSVVYRAGLFKEQTIASWMRQYTMLLRSIVAKPDTTIDMLETYTNEEKAKRAEEKAARNLAEAKRIRGTKGKGFEIR